MNANQTFREVNSHVGEAGAHLEKCTLLLKQAYESLNYDGDRQAYGKERKIEGAWDDIHNILLDLRDVQERVEYATKLRSWNYS